MSLTTMTTTTIMVGDLGNGRQTQEIEDLRVLDDPIRTEVSYLKYDPKHEHEKPYTVNYDTGDTFPRTNTTSDPHSILVHNFRNIQSPKSFEEYGFTSVKLPSALKPAEFDEHSKVEEVFYPEATRMLKQMFPDAAEIKLLEHQIRKRHPDFPIATGTGYKNLLPTTLVHIDFTPDSASRTSRAAYKDWTEQYRRLVAVNLWKSLQGPGNDWPLGLCDRRTVDHITEAVGQDIVAHDRYNENARLYYSPKHKWYYFENLQDDEIIVFQQMNSGMEGGGGVPHTGFRNPRADTGALPRVSVELRAFVYFK